MDEEYENINFIFRYNLLKKLDDRSLDLIIEFLELKDTIIFLNIDKSFRLAIKNSVDLKNFLTIKEKNCNSNIHCDKLCKDSQHHYSCLNFDISMMTRFSIKVEEVNFKKCKICGDFICQLCAEDEGVICECEDYECEKCLMNHSHSCAGGYCHGKIQSCYECKDIYSCDQCGEGLCEYCFDKIGGAMFSPSIDDKICRNCMHVI